jgi:hypothetical protein
MGGDMKALSDGIRELTNTVNNLGTKLDDMTVNVRDLSTKVDRLSLLAPVATNLAALPEKVTALQASAFENTQQVQALNLAVIHVEKTPRQGKAPEGAGGGSALNSDANDAPPTGPPKLPPFTGRLPRDYFHEEDDYNDTRPPQVPHLRRQGGSPTLAEPLRVFFSRPEHTGAPPCLVRRDAPGRRHPVVVLPAGDGIGYPIVQRFAQLVQQ